MPSMARRHCQQHAEGDGGRAGCLLANHGQICFGPNLDKALWLAGEIEALSQMYWAASLAGKPVILDDAHMAGLLKRFKTYGKQAGETKPGDAASVTGLKRKDGEIFLSKKDKKKKRRTRKRTRTRTNARTAARRTAELAEVALGIDVGTSGVRIAAADRQGRLVAMSTASVAAPLQNFGRLLQDPALWWDAVGQAFASLDLAGHQALALAVDGTSGTILPVSAHGEPMGLASMYNDLAEAEAVKKVASVAAKETAALGGSSPLARALMMDMSAPRILHQADWLMGRFCGALRCQRREQCVEDGI